VSLQEKLKMRLKINDSNILWPGKVRKKPEGIMIPTHLKVLTIEEKPFVYVRRMTEDETACEDEEVPCPHFNSSSGAGKLYHLANHEICRGALFPYLIGRFN
jgi:glutamate receptor ionotropic, NMDA 1